MDIFISHCWRFHSEWENFSKTLDEIYKENWRNFSLPWHDPALSPSNKFGMEILLNNLKTQIQPASLVIFLSSLFETESNLKWLEIEMKYALEMDKSIVGIINSEKKEFPPNFREHFQLICKEEIEEIRQALLSFE
jgi:hypothetical protein